MSWKIFDTVIIPSITLVILLVMTILLPFRKKKNLNKWGKCLLPLSGKKSKLFIPLICIIPLILAGIILHDFGSGVNLIFGFICILSFEMLCRDLIASGKYGIYENSLVTNGQVTMKDEFYALPTLQYEDTDEFKADKENDAYSSDSYQTAMKSLKIVTKNHGTFFVGFASIEERKAAVDILKNWV
jgi:hypothetical protein